MTLSGKQIVVTRAPHQATELADILRDHEAIPLAYPCINIAPPEDTSILDQALQSIHEYDWLVLTSSNTVRILSQRLDALGITNLEGVLIAAIGQSTAQLARAMLNVTVDMIPDEYVAESLAQTMNPKRGMRILLPQSAIARPVLAKMLTDAGAEVTTVDAYRTITGSGGVDLPVLLAKSNVDAVTFTSSSTVRNFKRRLESDGGDFAKVNGIAVACIGPVTGDTAREYGFQQIIIPDEYTLTEMVMALSHYLGSN